MRRDHPAQLVGPADDPPQQPFDEARVGLLESLQRARLRERVLAGELPGIERLQRDLARLAVFIHPRP
jgi:hypothetical protein